jgi:hypothetical protein
MTNSLTSAEAYQAFVYNLPNEYPIIQRSTLVYIPSGELYGRLEGMVVFEGNLVLCVQEFLNFELEVIEGYGYEVSRPQISLDDPNAPDALEYCKAAYPNKEKLYWYDSFPHPNDPKLAATDPHHRHVPPDIKHNRIPAPELSFTKPNLGFLIEEIQNSVLTSNET